MEEGNAMSKHKMNKLRGALSLLALVSILGFTPVLAEAGTVWFGADESTYYPDTGDWFACDNTSGSGEVYGQANTGSGTVRNNSPGYPNCGYVVVFGVTSHRVCRDLPDQPDDCSSWGL